MGSAHPSRGRALGSGSQSVAASMGFGGRQRYAGERGASRGREGAGQREREVGTGEKGRIKISLTGGVHV
jgi:hypothetical protein